VTTTRQKKKTMLKVAILEGRYHPDPRVIADAIIRRAQGRLSARPAAR
jgi:anti-sigma28 factor (negative regulator of flagellin synthesis)